MRFDVGRVVQVAIAARYGVELFVGCNDIAEGSAGGEVSPDTEARVRNGVCDVFPFDVGAIPDTNNQDFGPFSTPIGLVDLVAHALRAD